MCSRFDNGFPSRKPLKILKPGDVGERGSIFSSLQDQDPVRTSRRYENAQKAPTSLTHPL